MTRYTDTSHSLCYCDSLPEPSRCDFCTGTRQGTIDDYKSSLRWHRSLPYREASNLLRALKALLGIDNPPAGSPGHVDLVEAAKMGYAAIAAAEGK